MDSDVVRKAFELLCDLQNELTKALASLAGKQSRGFQDNFNVYSAGHINRAAEGFIFLTKASRIDASKFLIRPAIEAMFRLEAVRKQPDLLFRIAYTERIEDQKWIRRAAVRAQVSYDTAAEERRWSKAKKDYARQCPGHRLEEKELRVRDAAKAIGKTMEDYYDSHYLMYCKYTHAALRALGGSLNELADFEDARTMALSVFSALDILATIGGAAPNLESLRERMDELDAAP